MFEPIDTGSDSYRNFYERGSLRNTTFISVANLVFFVMLTIYGFVYVNASNMNCSRASLFHSSYPNYRDFATLILLIPVIYLGGNIVMLRSPTDTDPESDSALTDYDCLKNNMGFWFLGMFMGLNYTHYNQGFLKDLSFTPEKMRTWGPGLWIFGISMIVYYWANILFSAYCFISIGRGFFQLKVILAVVGPSILITIALRKTHQVHFHHYTGGLWGIPFHWFPHPIVIFQGGFCTGLLIEGVARWGFDSWWIPIENSQAAVKEKHTPL